MDIHVEKANLEIQEKNEVWVIFQGRVDTVKMLFRHV